ncbi:hypothetical protein E2C01_080696 [Portunus trituberculatus]|uniref:Uncharacterized protein n=1 Tax=Portunus trituberculatus TaxID=210409 RepID=A0A5B7IWT1_PORTR|nr:hypothetical protein [Portunus trituberculatus]
MVRHHHRHNQARSVISLSSAGQSRSLHSTIPFVIIMAPYPPPYKKRFIKILEFEVHLEVESNCATEEHGDDKVVNNLFWSQILSLLFIKGSTRLA